MYRSRKATRGLITGNEEAQYGLLRDYAEMILRTDVRSRVILQTMMENENAKPKFKKMYIRYNAQNVGFLGGCRPFIRLDGCHLKGRFGGQLLSATANDGNDKIYYQWQWLWLSKRTRIAGPSSWSNLQMTLAGQKSSIWYSSVTGRRYYHLAHDLLHAYLHYIECLLTCLLDCRAFYLQ